MTQLFALAAHHGRYLLLSGLAIGIALPGLARTLEAYVGELVVVLMFLNAFRSGRPLLAGFRTAPLEGAGLLLCIQLALPMGILLALLATLGTVPTFWLAAVLMLSSPSLSGNPNFIAMIGRNPATAMRLLVLGTLLFPPIAFAILWALPSVDGAAALRATLILAASILGVVTAGILARRATDARLPPEQTDKTCDGASALLLTIIVVGLMAEVGPLLRTEPKTLILWLLAVMSLNLILQIGGYATLRAMQHPSAVAGAVIAGNRNTVLYLIALPPQITAEIMLFVGCYQIPMYLTPIIMGRIFKAFPP